MRGAMRGSLESSLRAISRGVVGVVGGGLGICLLNKGERLTPHWREAAVVGGVLREECELHMIRLRDHLRQTTPPSLPLVFTDGFVAPPPLLLLPLLWLWPLVVVRVVVLLSGVCVCDSTPHEPPVPQLAQQLRW